MNQETLIAGLVAALIASAGVWWFRLILPVIKKQPKTTRLGVYAILWLAYFILIMIMIGRSSA